MTVDEKARLHVAILQALRSLGDLGMTESQLLNHVRQVGFDVALPALQVELRAICDRNNAAAFAPLGGRRYRITELGESKLAEAGL